MDPAIYQQWKRQQAERLKRERIRAARQPQPDPVIPEVISESKSKSPNPRKKKET